MGEVCVKHGYSPDWNIQRDDLSLTHHAETVVAMRIDDRTSKIT